MRFVVGISLISILVLPVLADEEEAETGSLVVRVKTDDGRALPQAEVLIWGKEAHVRATADEAGEARLEEVAIGVYSVSASAPGRTAVERNEIHVDAGLETRLELQLEKGIPFAGLVIGAGDAPVAGVYVEIQRGGTFEGYGETFADSTPYARTFTDDEGRFFVGGIPPERVATVVVQARDYEEARVCVRAIGDAVRPQPLVVRLVKGGEISGTVVDPDGKPVAGATVFAVPADHEGLRENPRIRGWSSTGSSYAAWTAVTDAEGAYRLRGLPLGDAYVTLADTVAHARSAWSEPFRPGPEKHAARVDLALRKPATIEVAVRAPEGHELGFVRAELGGHMSGFDAEAGAEPGTFAFVSVWPGTHTLTITARGYLAQRRPVEVKEGATVEVDVLLDAGVAIEGVVLDENGDGVAGVRVEAEQKEDDRAGWHEVVASRTETDEEGRFTLSGLRPGRHELAVGKQGFDLLETVTVEAPAKEVVLKGAHLGTLTIRFVDRDGEAVAYSEMVWRHKPDGSGGGSAESAKDDVFRLIGFRGEERLTFDFEGYVRVKRSVDIPPGKHLDLGTVTLDVGLTLTGRVVDPEGKPVADAVVSHEDYTDATSDADGRFALPHLPAGEIAVTVDAEGFLEAETQAAVGATTIPVEFILSQGTLLEGVVRDEKGEPLEEYWLRVERVNAEGVWKEDDYFSTDEDGAFEIRVKTGPCRISFYAKRDEPPVVLAAIDGEEGETRRLELTLAVPR